MWQSWENPAPARRRFSTFWRRLISLPAVLSCLVAGISRRYRKAGWRSFGGIIWDLCFQDFNLLDTFSLEDNIYLPLVLANVPYKEMVKAAEPDREDARYQGSAEKSIRTKCPAGRKQRAAVARALITRPKLILADEPTGALDSRSSEELLRLFSSVNQSGQTILMVTHSTAAASKANRVLFIKDGEVFHQIYRGSDSDEQLYQKISDTLTILMTGGEGR